jgi:hypothetical protein
MKSPTWPKIIITATPVIKPVITENGVKRVTQPKCNKPRVTWKMPIKNTRVTRAITREFSGNGISVSPAATANALVVKNYMKIALVKSDPTGFGSIAYTRLIQG